MIRRTGQDNTSTTRKPRSLTASSGAARAVAVSRSAYTLIELLITISIIGIMASMILFAMFSAQEQAKVQKTRALINRLNSIIQTRYESYRTRRVPITFTPTDPPLLVAKKKLDCLRDLMRMELPDRWSDISDPPYWPQPTPIKRPAASQAFYNRLNQNLTAKSLSLTDTIVVENQHAECLYLIVMEAITHEGDSKDVFKSDQIADTDGDGFLEFVDAWGKPIQFFRWAPGFISDLQTPIVASMNVASAGTHKYEVTCTYNPLNSKFNNTPGYYVGGTIAVVDKGEIRGDLMARITGYAIDTATNQVKFTCETPSTVGQNPFDPAPPSGSWDFAVMMPDPFDSRGVYPTYAGAGPAMPSFALYPVIVSSGPDKLIGLANKPQMKYSDYDINPFCMPEFVSMGRTNMVGSVPDTGTETGWYKGCDQDNIHNHTTSTR